MQLIEVDDFPTVLPSPGNSATVAPHQSELGGPTPDARWIAVAGSQGRSRCSLWWRDTPVHGRHRVGCIGHYAATDDQTAEVLLTHACQELRARGCTLAVGPMDGSTWCNYRFVTDSGDRPRFWMEPDNPLEWPRQFVRNGFSGLAEYFSAVNSQLARRDDRLERPARRLTATGVTLRPVCSHTFEADLRHIHGVARSAFRHNLLYSELGENEFLARSQSLHEFAPLQLSWLAEHDGSPVGFVFVVPDLCEQDRQSRIDTVIIKTLAAVPNRTYAGLGQLLLAKAHERARQLGYSAAIHALVRSIGGPSRISARYAQVMRRYTLFAKVLLP